MTDGHAPARPWQVLGAHPGHLDGTGGTDFAVWAPGARRVSVPGVRAGDRYRYVVRGADGRTRHKADPYAQSMDAPPGSASHVTTPSAHRWSDDAWLAERPRHDLHRSPMRIYEVHLGSWRRGPRGRFLTYEELGALLAEHCLR